MSEQEFEDPNAPSMIQSKLKLVESQIRRRCDVSLMLFFDEIAMSVGDQEKVKKGMTELKKRLEKK